MADHFDRRHVLATLRNALRTAAGRPVYLVGADGTGKSALIHEFARAYARDYGGRFLFGSDWAEHASPDMLGPLIFSITRDGGARFRKGHRSRSGTFVSRKPQLYQKLLLIFDGDPAVPSALATLNDINPWQRRLDIIVATNALPLGTAVPEHRVVPVPKIALDEIRSIILSRLRAAGTNYLLRDIDGLLEAASENGLLTSLAPNEAMVAIESLAVSSALPFSRQPSEPEFSDSLTFAVAPDEQGRLVTYATVAADIHGLPGSDGSLLTAIPLLVVPSIKARHRRAIADFEQLLNDAETSEHNLQNFFEANDHFLTGLDYLRAVPHVILQRDETGPLIPDFMLQPTDSPYADLVELKLPKEKLVVGTANRSRFGAAVHSAIAQVREYRHYFDDEYNRRVTLERYGLTAYRPRVTVIIGRRPESLADEGLKELEEDIPPYIRIVTYDRLLARMRRMAKLYA